MRKRKGNELDSHPYPLREEEVRMRNEFLSKRIKREDEYRMNREKSKESAIMHMKNAVPPQAHSGCSLKKAMEIHKEMEHDRRMAAYDRINGHLDFVMKTLDNMDKKLGITDKYKGGVAVDNKPIDLRLANQFLSDEAYKYIEDEIIKEIDDRWDVQSSLKNLTYSIKDLSTAFERCFDMTLKEKSFGGFDSISIKMGDYSHDVFHNGRYKNTHTFKVQSQEFKNALIENGCSCMRITNPSAKFTSKDEFNTFIHSMTHIALDEIAKNVCLSKEVLLSALSRNKYATSNLGEYVSIESILGERKGEKNVKPSKSWLDSQWFSILYTMAIIGGASSLIILGITKLGG